ncbi:MAG: hypothetical protein HDT46_02190 [Ruminococcaceae bacterium]|nr:hypothetical protein [Oscillospiraceae bacterium]
MNFKLNDCHRDISNEELLADVKRVTQKLSKNTPIQKEYKAAGEKYGTNTFQRHFAVGILY